MIYVKFYLPLFHHKGMTTAIITTIIANINLAIPLLEDEGLSTNNIHEIIIKMSVFINHNLQTVYLHCIYYMTFQNNIYFLACMWN